MQFNILKDIKALNPSNTLHCHAELDIILIIGRYIVYDFR